MVGFGKGVPHMKRRNRGQILVLFALALVVLIGMAALGIDVGYMYSVRHDLQRCADAGALAGASRFINAPGEMGTWADSAVQAEATARAIDYASKDNVVQTPLLSQPGDNVIVTFDQGPDKIKVQTERTVPLFFARMFLGPTKRITAFAVAEASSVSTDTTCMAPWGIPIPWVENPVPGNDPYKYDPEKGDQLTPIGKDALDPICKGFDEGSTFTQWSYQTHDNSSVRTLRDSYLCPGALMKLKIGTPAQTEPGWFRPLDLSNYAVDCDDPLNNSAPKLYTYLIKNRNCSDNGCRVKMDLSKPADQLIDVLTGDRVGPTVQAVAPYYYKNPVGEAYPDAIDWDSLMDGRVNPGDPADYGNDNYNDGGADWVFSIGTNGPRSDVTSRRIVTLPVYDPSVPVGQGGQGTIQPVAFVGFWIQDITPVNAGQATITGRLIEVTGPGSGPGGQGGATVKKIRLVE